MHYDTTDPKRKIYKQSDLLLKRVKNVQTKFGGVYRMFIKSWPGSCWWYFYGIFGYQTPHQSPLRFCGC